MLSRDRYNSYTKGIDLYYDTSVIEQLCPKTPQDVLSIESLFTLVGPYTQEREIDRYSFKLEKQVIFETAVFEQEEAERRMHNEHLQSSEQPAAAAAAAECVDEVPVEAPPPVERPYSSVTRTRVVRSRTAAATASDRTAAIERTSMSVSRKPMLRIPKIFSRRKTSE